MFCSTLKKQTPIDFRYGCMGFHPKILKTRILCVLYDGLTDLSIKIYPGNGRTDSGITKKARTDMDSKTEFRNRIFGSGDATLRDLTWFWVINYCPNTYLGRQQNLGRMQAR